MAEFILVRKEPSDEMIHEQYAQYGGDGLDMGGRFKAMLSSSPPPTDAELDELCRMMWPTTGIFEPSAAQFAADCPDSPDSPVAKGWAVTRDGYRRVMRQFLTALNGVKP